MLIGCPIVVLFRPFVDELLLILDGAEKLIEGYRIPDSKTD